MNSDVNVLIKRYRAIRKPLAKRITKTLVLENNYCNSRNNAY